MPDQPPRSPVASWIRVTPALAGALERASRAIARLDQALDGHPLRPAFLYRARLEAVRRQAAVDGQLIDPWHLAAMLEGLRMRMDHAMRIIDRGVIFEAARHALALHQWLIAPDFDQEGEVHQAAAALATPEADASPLLSAAIGVHAWLERGGARSPIRAALVRYWTMHRVIRAPVPLTGANALRAETDWEINAWAPAFLTALAGEADDARQLLLEMERSWFTARRAVNGRRRNSRAAAAIDLLAAAPLISSVTLASGLGMAVKNALELLAGFCVEGIAVEITHRSKRRLFGLAGLAQLRDEIAPPRRPQPGRGRGRPPTVQIEAEPSLPPPPERPLTPIERRAIDYSELDQAMAHLERAIRDTRRTLDALARGDISVIQARTAEDDNRDVRQTSGCEGAIDMTTDWSQCPDVESNPDVVSGAWVVRGTRIPADAVIDNADDGYTAEEIVAQIYPTLPLEPAKRVIAFALGGHAPHPVG